MLHQIFYMAMQKVRQMCLSAKLATSIFSETNVKDSLSTIKIVLKQLDEN